MQFPSSFLDELRNRLLPSAVVGKKVALKSNGREHGGLCPFHKEKTPSFTVSDEKGFYHCFGCGAHGDIIKFTMEADGLPFMEAVKKLAYDAGMAMPEMSRESQAKEIRRKSLYDVTKLACDFFQEQLQKSQEPMAYLKKRGITSEILTKFKIGFAPVGNENLKNFLKKHNISEQQMLAVGLVVQKNGGLIDKFRNRIMFPIIDTKERVVAFGGRVLGDGIPKYLNSPETEIFHKGSILYNENNARKLAFKTGKLVVAEGYMDVIALHMAGIKTAVAPLGTAITEQHLQRLWYITKEPVICLDGDKAGIGAMNRVANLALTMLEPGATLKFSLLPDGLDPDDFINKNGVEPLRQLLRNAKPLSEILWEDKKAEYNLNTPEKKAQLEQDLNALVEKIKNPTVAKYYKNFFYEKLWQLGRSKKTREKDTTNMAEIAQIPDFNIRSMQGCEKAILAFAINYPHLLSEYDGYEEFINIEFSSEKLDKIRQAILEVCGLESEIDTKSLIAHLENSGYSNDILYLKGLIGENIDFSKILTGWKYNIQMHHWLHLKLECFNIEKEMTDRSEKIVFELRKQIVEIESELKQMEIAFGE